MNHSKGPVAPSLWLGGMTTRLPDYRLKGRVSRLQVTGRNLSWGLSGSGVPQSLAQAARQRAGEQVEEADATEGYRDHQQLGHGGLGCVCCLSGHRSQDLETAGKAGIC